MQIHNFKTNIFVANKNNRDEWNKRKYDNMDKNREKEMKPYDPIEILRERNMELNKHSENRYCFNIYAYHLIIYTIKSN